MLKYFFIVLFSLLSFSSNSNENLLTFQQELERLQREVSDLSKFVFANKTDQQETIDKNLVTNLSAIDMRIYDLEKDVKNLTASIEEVYFQLEDLSNIIKELEYITLDIQKNISTNIQKNENINQKIKTDEISSSTNGNLQLEENTLGSLKITSDSDDTNSENGKILEESKSTNLSPEDQFQDAFDNIRNKNWENAKNSFQAFIENYPENQLSGSAHYWLGELYILEKKYRDAALILAEGYQKFPESIKAADMLFKLSQSLFEVNKVNESCKTLEKLIIDFPKNKFIKIAKKQIQDYGCLDAIE